MKLYSLILIISGCSLCVVAQNQNLAYQQKSNQDLIYFGDNRPGVNTNLSRPPGKTNVEVQKSVEPQNVADDSYAQADAGNLNYGTYFDAFNLNMNYGNRIPPQQQLSSNLRPPNYDKNGQNYYSSYSPNVAVRQSEANDQQVPITTIPTAPVVNNVSLALCNFGLTLLKNVNIRAANVVISPFSIAELLALLQQGALGLTQQQITEALGTKPQLSVEVYKTINERLKKRSSSRNILRVANNLYVADGFSLKPTFQRVAMQSFGSEVTPMSFSRSEEAVQKINQWVSQKTNNKITELLRSDAVGDNTQMVMVNAVYFKGIWAVRFKPESTLPRDFNVNGVVTKSIPFMRTRKIFKSGVDPVNNAQVLLLPFENEQYLLMVVLPSPDSTLDALVSQLSDAQLASYANFSPKEIDLEIPKFTVKTDTDLNSVFKKMGMANLFTNRAELSGVGSYQANSPHLSAAQHSAMLSIDEDGGSAAAATSFAVVALSYDDSSTAFKVNRPFLTVLWDSESALPLFMARIQDPTL